MSTTAKARVYALWLRLRDAEPAQLIQYAATVLAAAAAFGVAVPLGLDARIAAGITVAAAVRDLFVSRATRAAVWSPDSVTRLQDAAVALGAPQDRVGQVAALLASGQMERLHELLAELDDIGQHAVDRED